MVSSTKKLDDLGFTKNQLRATFIYLFRGMNHMEFRAHFDHGISAKKKIDSSGYVLLNCKLFAWAYAKGKGPKPKDYNVTKEDARFLRTLDLSFVPKKFQAWDLGEFRLAVERQLFAPDLDVYIGKFISKKLRFLQNYGLWRSDIANDLRTAALYNIYRMYPGYKSELHIKNIAKQAIKNAGKELIYKNTRQSRQALRRLSDGTFESLITPLNNPEFTNMVVVQDFDVTAHMQRLCKAYLRCTPRAQKFISLLTGQPDDEFSRFLGKRNDVAFEEMEFAEYCARVQSHLGIADKQKLRFFEKIRRL